MLSIGVNEGVISEDCGLSTCNGASKVTCKIKYNFGIVVLLKFYLVLNIHFIEEFVKRFWYNVCLILTLPTGLVATQVYVPSSSGKASEIRKTKCPSSEVIEKYLLCLINVLPFIH